MCRTPETSIAGALQTGSYQTSVLSIARKKLKLLPADDWHLLLLATRAGRSRYLPHSVFVWSKNS